jgi:sugar phosphate permease
MARLAESAPRTFALTWLSYVGYYLTRQNLSAVKDVLQTSRGLTGAQLAHIDSLYLGAYAAGQFIWGFVSDRVGPRRVIALGMLVTAGLSVAFGLSTLYAALLLIWGANGLAQASGWPANVKAMTAVATPERRGVIMGFWGTNYLIGGLGAPALAALAFAYGGFEAAFWVPAIVVATIGIAVLLWLPDVHATAAAPTPAEREAIRAERRAAYRVVLRERRVWLLGCSYFFLKLTRYALLFWLPYYGKTVLHYTTGEAVGVSLAFQIGGAVGAMTVGIVSDRWLGGRRIPLCVISLVLMSAVVATYGWASHESMTVNFIWLILIGIFLFGPDAIICGAAAQDVGGKAAAAACAGIINGIGSIGPVFGLEAWKAFSAAYGWSASFVLLGAGGIVSALVVLPLWRMRPTPHG